MAAGAAEVAVADTIGVGLAARRARGARRRRRGDRRLGRAGQAAGPLPQHPQHGTGQRLGGGGGRGRTSLDASLGGIGGCPFAPGATGNIPTEDLAYLLERSGVASGFHLGELVEIVPWIEEQLGARVPGLLAKAGLFPK